MGMRPWLMVPLDGAAPPGLPGALDLATCVSNADRSVVRTSSSPPSLVAYNSDGTEAWCNGTSTSNAAGFDLSPDYILPGGTPTNNGNNISASTAAEGSWKWSYNGLHLYNGGNTARVRTLTIPFLLSTATQTSVNAAMNSSRGSTITSDGLRVYLAETAGTARIFRWDLSVAWDLTTAVQDVANVVAVGETALGVAISNDETRIYITNNTGDAIEYIMGTPGDLTTIPLSIGVAVPNYTLVVALADLSTTTCLYIAYDMSHMLIGGSTTLPSSACGFYSLTGSPV
jgi:hypothetical protein